MSQGAGEMPPHVLRLADPPAPFLELQDENQNVANGLLRYPSPGNESKILVGPMVEFSHSEGTSLKHGKYPSFTQKDLE